MSEYVAAWLDDYVSGASASRAFVAGREAGKLIGLAACARVAHDIQRDLYARIDALDAENAALRADLAELRAAAIATATATAPPSTDGGRCDTAENAHGNLSIPDTNPVPTPVSAAAPTRVLQPASASASPSVFSIAPLPH